MKKTILLIMLTFLMGFVLGQAFGTIITQAQVDAQDFGIRSLDIEIDNVEKTSDRILLHLNYKTLHKITEADVNVNVQSELDLVGDYNVVQRKISFQFPLEKYHSCREFGESRQFCKKQVIIDLKAQNQRFKFRERQRLTDYQTNTFADELTASDITITNEELNAN